MLSSLGQREKGAFLQKKQESTTATFQLGPLNLAISKGKLTSILGRSGSGKTTLLSMLGLLRQHDKGDISIHTNSILTTAKQIWQKGQALELFRAENIGFALQKGELLPQLTMYENAALILRFLGDSDAEIEQKLRTKFERLYATEKQNNQLEKLIKSKPSNVSQGQYQRGAIVRALANNPPIILADEPTGNLDEHTGQEAMKIFRELVETPQQDGVAQSVIVVTHDILLAVAFADEIIILSNGQQAGHFIHDRSQQHWYARENPSEVLSEEALKEAILSILK